MAKIINPMKFGNVWKGFEGWWKGEKNQINGNKFSNAFDMINNGKNMAGFKNTIETGPTGPFDSAAKDITNDLFGKMNIGK